MTHSQDDMVVPTLTRLLNLALVGMLTGHEFAGLVAVYPALGTLPPLTRLEAEQAVYHRYGKIMPVYMSATIASFVPVLALERDRTSPAFRCTVGGLACYLTMLGVTLTQNFPINTRIEQLPAEEASVAEFRNLRARWDRLHAARNVLNLAGLVFTCLGALSRARLTGCSR